MEPTDIRKHLRRQPFRPFRIYMSDGATYDIHHPELAYIGASDLVVAVELGEADLPDRSAYLDPRHVTRIEPLNGDKKKPKSKRKSR